jgi:hypothetical protein
MMISIPPKYAVSQVVGFIKGKSAIHLARGCGEKKRNFVGQHFWARGFVSTVGRDETCGVDRATFRWLTNEYRVASATLTAASSGPIPKAPGSAGGYLLAIGRPPGSASDKSLAAWRRSSVKFQDQMDRLRVVTRDGFESVLVKHLQHRSVLRQNFRGQFV